MAGERSRGPWAVRGDRPTAQASRFTVVNPKCKKCDKSVYPMEKVAVESDVFHKTCFRCGECNKVLSLGTYAAIAGTYYCKPHFKQLFALKGNYDEGFGHEQHKAKWAAKAADATAAAE